MFKKIFSDDAAKGLVEEAVQKGAQLARVLAGTGLAPDWMAAPPSTISAEQHSRLILNAIVESGEPAIGFDVTGQINFLEYARRYGFYVLAFSCCANWGQASRIGIQLWDFLGSQVWPKFIDEGDTCCWEIFLRLNPTDPRVLVYSMERFHASVLTTILYATGSPAPVKEIWFSYPPPEHADLYEMHLNAPVFFSKSRNLLRMDSNVMDRPMLLAQPELLPICIEHCKQVLFNLKVRSELAWQIRGQIIGSSGKFPTATKMADKLGMTPRTLRRRLEQEGTSYRDLISEFKTELAVGYLTSTSLSIDEIAILLGFSETTSFRRSFKKWTGKSAAETRAAVATKLADHEAGI